MSSAAALMAPSANRLDQITRAEQAARLAEHKLALNQKGSQQTRGTCPWATSDADETASVASSRQASSRNTCPWGADEAPAAKPKKLLGNGDRSTCPWSANALDKDSERLQDAARRRQKPSPSNQGRAGAGAPKMFGRDAPFGVDAPAAVPERALPNRDAAAAAAFAAVQQPGYAPAEFTQRMDPCPQQTDGDDEDEQDKEEQRELIQHCLAEGMDEDKILEVLDDWQNAKLLRKTEENMKRQQGQALGVCGNSLAANRQSKAAKSLSFGPSDEEIVGVLNEYTKDNMGTPPQAESPPKAVSLADRRKNARQPSEAAVGGFDADKSRVAYLESKKQMEAVKAKQRVSSGIF